MFCEVLPYSWTKGFYKREGKSNVKRDWLAERPKKKKRLGKRYERESLKCSGNVFYCAYN